MVCFRQDAFRTGIKSLPNMVVDLAVCSKFCHFFSHSESWKRELYLGSFLGGQYAKLSISGTVVNNLLFTLS